MKRRRILTAALAMLLLAGCAENPDSDIIVHKDMEKLIGEAQQTDESKADVEELRQYDSYTADIENESLRVSIHADAKVDIPQTDKLSIFRVKQHEFTQEEVDAVRQALLGDTELYDGVLMTQQTKADLEQEIASIRASLDEEIARVPKNESEERDRTTMIEEWQNALDRLQAQYEAAPFEAQKVISDGKLQNAAEMLQKGESPEYWRWQNDLECKESIMLRNADNTAVFYAQNNPNYSNKICFRTSPVGPEEYGGVTVMTDSLDAKTKNGIDDPFLDHRADLQGVKVEPMPGDSCTLTREQAEQQAQAFMQQIGQADFACFEGGRYAEYLMVARNADDDRRYYRTCWILRYCREIGGVLLEQNSGMKYGETGSGEDYKKHLWPPEMIELHINDAGIVWLDWHAPLEITETVVEESTLKPFSEICSTFEQMMPMVAASPEQNETPSEISINRVTLSYSRISEKDSFDTGLVIPVWGFRGSSKEVYDGNAMNPTYYTQMAINAIDGSVIDGILGY